MTSNQGREAADVAAMWKAVGIAKTSETLDQHWLRFMAYAVQYARLSHAQIYQDLWVLWETRARRDGYFVEVGACDGIFLSNTLLLERNYGWNGIVVEPNPVFHADLAQNRRCHIDQRCVWQESGERLGFRAVAQPEYSVLQRVDPRDDHEAGGVRANFDLVEVETVTLTDLLLQAEAPKIIDYLSLDTEGAELDILRSFDFDAFDVRLISVEHNYTTRRREITDLLVSKGYRPRYRDATRWDDWYLGPIR